MRPGAREELVKLRTGLARLALKAGLAEHVPGAPTREAPFEELVKLAEKHERGWNALIARLMDKVVPVTSGSHEPGCDLFANRPSCSCSPYNMEG